jgi:hypothetical protein
MRKLALLLSFLVAAGASAAAQPLEQSQPAAMKSTKELAVQVVSTDTVGKTITVKKEYSAGGQTATGRETTLPVEADAVAALKSVSPGEKVKLICRTNGAGIETAVTAIQKADKPKEQ